VGKPFSSLRVCINGAGAAGNAIAKMLLGVNLPKSASRVKEVIVCDSKGIIFRGRKGMDSEKAELARITNLRRRKGKLADAIKRMDAFIGVSIANQLSEEMVRSMTKKSIVLAMANPTPEIMPDVALRAGAAVVGTGRSDFPNQVNNALAFPGVFRGAMDARATRVTPKMEIAAAHALAGMIASPTAEKILPPLSDRRISKVVARAVKRAV
jgi:malate dehydrogenase (oxaloacetate-decarboxylating)